jgi:hypothetical protein
MSQDWEKVVAAAIERGVVEASGPVSGARLRHIIAEIAQADGLVFPPVANQPFGKFLDQFSNIALVQRRPGADMLVVPAQSAELLTQPPGGVRASRDTPTLVLRSDLFEALTRIPKEGKETPVYNRHTDEVIWLPTSDPLSENTVKMPTATLEQAIQDRREFAASTTVPHEKVREILATCLSANRPLRSFSEAVKAHGVAWTWHRFRIGLVVKRLQAWSQEHHIPWGADWLRDGRTDPIEAPKTAKIAESQAPVQEFFAALAATVREGDLSRINIPLDLVLKAWSRRN